MRLIKPVEHAHPMTRHDPPFKVAPYLATLPLFRELDRDEINRIAAATLLIEAPRGSVLFRRGDLCSGFHIVIFGQIKLALQKDQGGEKVIELLTAGQSFGEAMMFLDQPYIPTAEALADTKLLHVPRSAVFAELDRDPRLARRLIASLSMRLHHLMRDLESYTLQSGMQRVIGYLLSLIEDPGDTQIKLPARKNIIASRLNLTHEHFSRILHELALAGLICVHGQEITMANIEKLRGYGAHPGRSPRPPKHNKPN
ncbi:MAG: Crp/Fnr family transcriptional regulator [Burkholderiales bacterium]|nr:Crp/Fnr family transcriptional regulator [Burkholderiales bacterium]